MAKDII
jgi:hypothetical protein